MNWSLPNTVKAPPLPGAVERFERAFAEYVGAKYAIAMCNGTATLHTALAALGVCNDRWADGSPDEVAVPPLTMAATTIAVLHAGGRPVFVDVNPDTWLMDGPTPRVSAAMPVSLYGLHQFHGPGSEQGCIDDAAQTLRPHQGAAFTSYSFQASKILPLGEGGMLVTDDKVLARRARELSSLGYHMTSDGPYIETEVLKDPDRDRHHRPNSYNYRLSALVAIEGLLLLNVADVMLAERRRAASFYRDAIEGCSWITPQRRPEGWEHDYWCYAVALESKELWHPFVEAIERHGGERPYAAWRITYQEPAFRHLAEDGTCPIAEDLQPRLVQFQTNHIESARRNAVAVGRAIRVFGSAP